MVLEEILVVRGPLDVPEVARACKEAGMPARITQTVALESLVVAKGKIGGFKALLREQIARFEEPAGESRIEGGAEGPAPGEADEDAALREFRVSSLGIVERVAETIAEFMEMHRPGDVVPRADLEEWMVQPARVPGGEEPVESASPGVERFPLHKFIAISTLDANGLIRAGDEGVVVQGHMDPEDIAITLPGSVVDDIDREILKEHGILVEMTVTPVPECRLEFGPEAILDGDLDEIDDLAGDLDIDEGDYISFREGVSLKRIVIARTLEILEERGTLTTAEVVEALGSGAFGDTEEGWSIVLDLTPEFVKGLLGDLKKIGLVRKKGGGFRAI